MLKKSYSVVSSFKSRATSKIYCFYAKLRRATVESSVVFRGKPLIRCSKGGVLKIGDNSTINSRLSSNPIMGNPCCSLSVVHSMGELIIGEGVGMSSTCITAAKSVTIGDHTIIGADAMITDTDFHLPGEDGVWTNDVLGSSAAVQIGRSCFIGARAIILKGVEIGDNCVVAAGAVVSRDVPENHLAYGNPSQVKPLTGKWVRN